MQHFGFAALIGRPNVGKSTLMNHLIGHKVAITTRRPQTTRQRITGILTDGDYQCAFIDTPGLHLRERRTLNRLMNRNARQALEGVDLILAVVEAGALQADDELVFKQLQGHSAPIIAVINKIDRLRDRTALLPLIAALRQRLRAAEFVPVSALQGRNLEDLKAVIYAALPPAPHGFAQDSITDCPQQLQVAEIIREKLMRQMGDELPYSCMVEVEDWQAGSRAQVISAAIIVERQGQKKMVIGRGGRRIKQIGSQARADLEKLLASHVCLRLFVKVRPDWADNARSLQQLGAADFETLGS